MMTEVEEEAAEKLQALQRSWRKVASTHALQDLLLTDDEKQSIKWPAWQRRLCGLALVISSVAVAAAATWVLAIHFMPPSPYPLVQAIQDDWYYCCLVPLTLPVAAFAAGLNWYSLKLFKHNS